MMDFVAKTHSLLVPTSTHVSPIPTVLPTQPIYEHVGKSGGTTLWVVFCIMFFSTLAFIAMAARVPVQKRLFHVITATITLVAAISYFAMATGDGIGYVHSIVREGHKHVPDTTEEIFRQVFTARYIDWTITTPLLLLDLALLAGISGADIIVAIIADLVMVLTGLFAAYGHSAGQKWGYFAMACVAYLFIVWILAVGGRRAAARKNDATAKFFGAIGGFTFILWSLYPVVFGFGDGSGILSVDSEIIAYAVLDVLAKPVFGFWLLVTHARNSAESVEGFWAHGLNSEGAVRLDDDEGN